MTFDEAVKSIYARHAAGCCLHLVLDDLNTDDASVQLCFNTAFEERHIDCIVAAALLKTMSDESGERDMRIGLATGEIT